MLKTEKTIAYSLEKLLRILRSYKTRSTFYFETKLLCKPKNRVATEDKINIVYEIDCSNCEVVYFGESKQSLKLSSDEHKISFRIAIVKRMKLRNAVGK